MELYYDFSFSLYYLILETYLGEEDNINETKIVMSNEDKQKHFDWCWNKTINNFNKENIAFKDKGEHYNYFNQFFIDTFYNQKEDKMRKTIETFFNDVFNRKKSFTKSDLDIILNIYKSLDKNMVL